MKRYLKDMKNVPLEERMALLENDALATVHTSMYTEDRKALPFMGHRLKAAQIVLEGLCGFLARSPAQWSQRLAQLLADPQLRESLGRAGRARAREHYSLEAVTPRLAGVLRAAAARKAPQAPRSGLA